MPARSVCLVTLSLSEAGPGRFGRQVSVTDIYHTIPYHTSELPPASPLQRCTCMRLCFVHMYLCLCAVRAYVLHLSAKVRQEPDTHAKPDPGNGGFFSCPTCSILPSISLSFSLSRSCSLFPSVSLPPLPRSMHLSYPLALCTSAILFY